MNFKFIFLLLTLFGCGVKSDPIPPEGTAIPSYESQYLVSKEEKQKSKESKKEVKKDSQSSH
ncbi:MAG: hypothetical protein KC493_09985 [Bacteriovoracaceae bacterium]|nr:hypothetical protein [Bacteriovoracaceae bacterium]